MPETRRSDDGGAERVAGGRPVVREGRRFRRRPLVRAFRDKRGGWTIVGDRLRPAGGAETTAGEETRPVWRVTSPAACLLWEALERPVLARELDALLVRRFPAVDPTRLATDGRAFLDCLSTAGLLEEAMLPQVPSASSPPGALSSR